MSTLENGKPGRKTVNPTPKGFQFEPTRDEVRGFLSDEEKAAIREKARAQVDRERKDKEEAILLKQYLKEERAEFDPEEGSVPIYLDLALHSPYIMLDGTQYLNNTLYEVTPNIFRVLSEQMARGWAHEEETEVREARSRRRGHRMPAHVGIGNFVDHRVPRELKMPVGVLLGANPAALLGV